jgi:hypothetical protein
MFPRINESGLDRISSLTTTTSQTNIDDLSLTGLLFHCTLPTTACRKAAAKSTAGNMAAPANLNFPPPKTDKPRPHVCTTCMRSFARLEHLKRHERSHTQEKLSRDGPST